MNANYIIKPSTGEKITDGTIVRLSSFPGAKWITHYGWYTCNNHKHCGWYFSSIPEGAVIPLDSHELDSLTILSVSGNCSGCECEEVGTHSHGHGLSPQQAYELDHSWITVDTIAIRDELNKRLLPDGKVVRVNRTESGNPEYFAWNQVSQKWEQLILGSSGQGLTQDKADALYASKTEVQTIQNSTQWKLVK